MQEECKKCNRKQVYNLAKMLNLGPEKTNELIDFTNDYLSNDFTGKTNPEVMGLLYRDILNLTGHHDPYKKIKSQYNQLLLSHEQLIEGIIDRSEDKFKTALKIAITGNLIDFSAKHQFDQHMLIEKINSILDSNLAVDHCNSLKRRLDSARTLLYLGDNCGEIVLDKIFINQIIKMFPDLEIIFAVRGQSVVNDATLDDVTEIKLDMICKCISNGDGSLGTVLSRVDSNFSKIFNKADVIISKGQGNLESLMNEDRDNIYFMFMVKCDLVGDPLGLDLYDIVCLESGSIQK